DARPNRRGRQGIRKRHAAHRRLGAASPLSRSCDARRTISACARAVGGRGIISSQLAIARLQRDLTLGRLVNWALFAGIVLCVPLGASFDQRYGAVLSLTVLGLVWIALGYQSMKGSRLAAGSPRLIAAGQFDQAEYQIEQALRSFSLFRTSKLMSLHHLAVLR